jgi:hypothetical protein
MEQSANKKESESAPPQYADDHSKSLKFDYEDIKDIADEQG